MQCVRAHVICTALLPLSSCQHILTQARTQTLMYTSELDTYVKKGIEYSQVGMHAAAAHWYAQVLAHNTGRPFVLPDDDATDGQAALRLRAEETAAEAAAVKADPNSSRRAIAIAAWRAQFAADKAADVARWRKHAAKMRSGGDNTLDRVVLNNADADTYGKMGVSSKENYLHVCFYVLVFWWC